MGRAQTWAVIVVAASGDVDSGVYTLLPPVVVDRKRIADTLADMTWRIVMDLAESDPDDISPSGATDPDDISPADPPPESSDDGQ